MAQPTPQVDGRSQHEVLIGRTTCVPLPRWGWALLGVVAVVFLTAAIVGR
jgi:hypothetical protein